MLHLHHLIGSSSNDNGNDYENVTKWRWFSLLSRGRFVLWGGWGERKRKRAGHDGKGKQRREAPAFSLFPSFAARFLFFNYCYFYRDTPDSYPVAIYVFLG